MPEDKLKKLHSNLSEKWDGFAVPYDQFKSDMQKDENIARLHKNLTDKWDGFNVPLDQFKADMAIKKKDQTESAFSLPVYGTQSEQVQPPLKLDGKKKDALPGPFDPNRPEQPPKQKLNEEEESIVTSIRDKYQRQYEDQIKTAENPDELYEQINSKMVDEVNQTVSAYRNIEFDKMRSKKPGDLETAPISSTISAIDRTFYGLAPDVLDAFGVGTKFFNDNVLRPIGIMDKDKKTDINELPSGKAANWLRTKLEELTPIKEGDEGKIYTEVGKGIGQALSLMVGGAGSLTAKGTVVSTKSTGAASSLYANLTSRTSQLASAQMAGIGYKEAKSKGATDAEAFLAAFTEGLIGKTEALPIGKALERLNGLTGNRLGQILINGFTGTVEEASQEALQGYLSNFAAEKIYDEGRKLTDGLFEQAYVGGATGFILNALMTGIAGRRRGASVQENAELDKLENYIDEQRQKYDQAVEVTLKKADQVMEQMPDAVKPEKPLDLNQSIEELADKMDNDTDPNQKIKDADQAAKQLEKNIFKPGDTVDLVVNPIDPITPQPLESNAIEQEQVEQGSQPEYQQTEEGGLPAGPSDSDSNVGGGQVQEAQVTEEQQVAPEQALPPEPPKIYNNEAVYAGGPKKTTQANIRPELTVENQEYDPVTNQNAVNEAKRMLNDNEVSKVEEAVKDKRNDMEPILRRAASLELAKKYKREGDIDKSQEMFNFYKDIGKQGGQAAQFGIIALQDPEVQTMSLREDIRQKNNEVLQQRSETGQTIGTEIDQSFDKIRNIAEQEGVKVAESDPVEKVIDNIVKKRLSQQRRSNRGEARVRKARNDRKKLIDEYKKKPDDLFAASLVPGLTPKGVEYAVKIGKTYIDEGVGNIEQVVENIRQHFKETYGKDIEDMESIRQQLLQQQTSAGIPRQEIKNLIKEHYTVKDAAKQSLKEKIISQFDNLSEADAKAISDQVEQEFNRRVREESNKELTRLYGVTRVPNKKQVKSDSDKIMEAMNMGAFDDRFYKTLVGMKLGLARLTDADVKALEDIARAINDMPNGEMKSKEIQKFEDYVDSIKDKSKFAVMSDKFLEMWYTNILSGFSTQSRALKGATTTAFLSTFAAAINNPVATFYGLNGIKRMIAGSKSFGYQGWRQVIKDGYSDIEFFDRRVKKQGWLNKIVNNKLKNLVKEKKYLDATVKFWFHYPAKMYRALIATDALMKYGLKEYEAYIYEYNKLLAEDPSINRTGTEFANKLNKRLAIDRGSVEVAQEQLNAELDYFKEKGIELDKGYASRRLAQIQDDMRDPETVKASFFKASEAVLMNDPVGILGSFYRTVTQVSNIKEGDSKTKMMGKLVFRSIFPFVRVGTNFINTNLDYTPIGFWRGYRGYRAAREGKIGMTPEERQRHYVKASVGTSVAIGMIATLFNYDDERGFVLDEDAPIQITAGGKGTYYENLGISEDYKQFSFRMKNPFSGEWTGWYSYIDNPLGMVLAPFGYMSDDIKFKDFKKKVSGRDYEEEARTMGYFAAQSIYNATEFASSQSYSQGIKTLVNLMPNDRNSAENMEENIADLISRPAKGVIMANFYKQIYGQTKALLEIPQKEAVTIPEKIIKDIPLIESVLNHYQYDQLGYETIKDWDMPLVPDIILKQIKDNRTYREEKPEWRLIYKYDQVTIGPNVKAPDILGGKRLTREQKLGYVKFVGDYTREQINERFSELDLLPPVELQYELDRIRTEARREAKNAIVPPEPKPMFNFNFDFDMKYE